MLLRRIGFVTETDTEVKGISGMDEPGCNAETETGKTLDKNRASFEQ